MNLGIAAIRYPGVHTIALRIWGSSKFDFSVMMNGYKFLQEIKPGSISRARFPYYGHFYGTVGMRLLGQEMTHLTQEIAGYQQATSKDLLSWQQEDGSWPVKSWMKSGALQWSAQQSLRVQRGESAPARSRQ